ncbi:MAG: 50S ribosomal protein L25 [Acidobacteria bacterium]|nr:50S ribosomal protein L25 [Acidobacteriota bacterium]
MENVMTLKAESRNEVGKKIAKKLRRDGRIPAIIYGEKEESIPISLAVSDIKIILKSKSGENTVLKIHRDNTQMDAMLKEVQYDYLSDTIIHADLIRIDLNKPVVVNVPIVVTGEPVGVKVEGGFFEFITRGRYQTWRRN